MAHGSLNQKPQALKVQGAIKFSLERSSRYLDGWPLASVRCSDLPGVCL